LRTLGLLGTLLLVGALAAPVYGGPLVDPTLASNLPEVTANLPGALAAPLFLGEPEAAVGVPVPWWETLTQLGLGLGVSRLPSDHSPSLLAGDLLNPRELSVTTFGVSLQRESLWGGDGREAPFRPYVGIGPALFVTSLADVTFRPSHGPYDLDAIQAANAERTGAALGLQAQAGLRYSLSRAWTIFGEYRLAQPAYGLSGPEADGGKTLGVHRFQGGLSIQFR
jgi:hypothetical protein